MIPNKFKVSTVLFFGILLINSFFLIKVTFFKFDDDIIEPDIPTYIQNYKLGAKDSTLNQNYFLENVGIKNPLGLINTVYFVLGKKNIKDTFSVYKFFIDSIYATKLSNFDSTVRFKPTRINELINQGYNFKYASTFFTKDSIYLKTIADIYFKNAAQQLEYYQNKNAQLTRNFHYQYLRQRCLEASVLPNKRESAMDKFLNTLLEEDYFHLINTTWNKSSLIIKFLIFSVFILCFIGLVTVIKFIKVYIKKNI